ncbi:MAG: DNA cytosine methyltransferase [Syntrophobacter sp.]
MTGLIVDLFAGGGGASSGIRAALGKDPDIAINHDAIAVAMHAANHLNTCHYQEDIWKVHPLVATRGQHVSLLWASPDCKHFSKAKGGPPIRSREIRSLAWVVVKWAQTVKPRVIILENVEEFTTWGPLDEEGRIIEAQKGFTFRTFIHQLRRQGYQVEYRCLRACDYGAPTTRKRLFLIARCDGLPIIWPNPTHGSGLLPYRTATEIIDWSIPCPSIFERKRPLAENTLRRIAQGIKRYVLDTADPFILTYYGPKNENDFRGRGVNEPLPTQSTENRFGIVTPYISRIGQTGGNGKYCNSMDDPISTITSKAEHLLCLPHLQRQFGNSVGQGCSEPTETVMPGGGGKTALVSAFLAKHYGGVVGQELRPPIGTVTATDHHSLVTSNLIKFKGTCKDGQDVREPLHTVQSGGNHYGEVRAFLMKYYGEGGQLQTCGEPVHTIPTKDRMGLITVTIAGEPYVITDIGMRMLQPKELFRAQGFPEDYKIDIEVEGKKISKSDQVRMCGNSVCPPIAEALVRANCIEHSGQELKRRLRMFQ